LPQRSTAKKPVEAVTPGSRRPRGEPRKLLLAAARDLFARQDYRSTTTREIAEAAGVTEHLLFRNFGSKAGLFREALVLPFTEFVDDFGRTWNSVVPEETDEDELTRRFVGQQLAETGIAEIRRALTVLSQIGAEGMRIRGMRTSNPDLPAHSTVAMIAGMAALRSTYFGTKAPPRQAIVDELVQAILHGFLHRQD
jgi:AcrR family transcriptional regulator